MEARLPEETVKPNGVCSPGFQNFLGPVTFFLSIFSLFQTEISITASLQVCLFHHCIFGAENLFTEFYRFIDEMELCLQMDRIPEHHSYLI